MLQLRNITSINNAGRARTACTGILCAVLIVAGCKQDALNTSTPRPRLGDISIAVVRGDSGVSAAAFSARVIKPNGGDTLVPGVGHFFRHVVLWDSLANRAAAILYSVPRNAFIQSDTNTRVVCFFKRVGSRAALLLKSKNDSLICMIGTLLPDDLASLQAESGAQGFHVASGPNVYTWRNSECGREGDYDMLFSTNTASVSVPPVQNGLLQSGEKSYILWNAANTRLVKDLGTCPDFLTEFSYMILRQ